MGELGHVDEPFGRIECDRAARRGLQPGWQIGADRGGCREMDAVTELCRHRSGVPRGARISCQCAGVTRGVSPRQAAPHVPPRGSSHPPTPLV